MSTHRPLLLGLAPAHNHWHSASWMLFRCGGILVRVTGLRACPFRRVHDLLLENCTLPSSRPSGESIIRTLRQYLQNLGRVGSCNAYFDLNQFSSIKLGAFRSLLHSSGISLIDCPHNGGKDVVDKRIIGQHHSVVTLRVRSGATYDLDCNSGHLCLGLG